MKTELTSRIYATIHAPADIPGWFMPDADMVLPANLDPLNRKFGGSSDHEYKDYFISFYFEDDDVWTTFRDDQETIDLFKTIPESLKIEVAEYVKLRHEAYQARERYKKYWEIDRYFLWRKFFADKITGNDYISRPGSPEEIDSLEAVIGEQDQQIIELKAWKESMINASPDYNAIGEIIGLKIGQSVSTNILPWMQEAYRLLGMSVSLTDEKSITELDGIIRKFLNHG